MIHRRMVMIRTTAAVIMIIIMSDVILSVAVGAVSR